MSAAEMRAILKKKDSRPSLRNPRTPVGERAVAFGQLGLMGSVVAHHIYRWRIPAAGGAEDDVAAVGRPAGMFVAAVSYSQALHVRAVGVHRENIIGRSAPTEDDLFAVGRPIGRIVLIAVEGESLCAAAVYRGLEEMQFSRAFRGEDDLRSIRREAGRQIHAERGRHRMHLAAGRAHDIEIGIAFLRGAEGDERAVG